MINFLANPLRFKKFANIAAPIFGLLAFIFITSGLYFGLYSSPEDQLQGHSVRIMYVHVPAVWTGMSAYGGMAVASLLAYIWRHPLSDELARALALPGAAFTALGLMTGSLWGKTSWGTFWQWDGRMTSTLILLFLFIGYIAIWAGIDDKRRAARVAGLVAMVGSINLPIIKFSVDWWNTLHQTSSVSMPNAPGLPGSILLPLLLMTFGYTFFLGWVVLNRVLCSIALAKIRRKRPLAATTSLEKL
jgi:heme exporter protein C